MPKKGNKDYKPTTVARRNIRLHKTKIIVFFRKSAKPLFHILHSCFHRVNMEKPPVNTGFTGDTVVFDRVSHKAVKNFIGLQNIWNGYE